MQPLSGRARDDYVRRELSNPRPDYNDELRKLGFAGASALERTRQHLQKIKTQQEQATEPKLEPIQKGRQITPEIAPGREAAVGAAVDRAIAPDTQLGQDIASSAKVASPATQLGVGIAASLIPGVTTAAHLARHEPVSGTDVALDIGSFVPPLRGARALVEGARALKAGEGARAAVTAARASMRAPGPISQVAKKIPLRTFKVGEHEVAIPAASSRTGRTLEKLGDQVLRPAFSKVGVMKSEPERAGQEFGYSQHIRQEVQRAIPDALAKVGKKLNDAEEYALRVVVEGEDPAQRIAHHEQLALSTKHKDQALYHTIHADLTKKASKYVDMVDDPERGLVPALKPEAPKALHEALDLFQQAGAQREGVIKDLGRISDEQIAARIHAPARVLRGARYSSYEDKIKQLIENHPTLREMRSKIDQTVQDPREAEGLKAILNTYSRSVAERIAKNPEDIGKLASHIAEVRTNVDPATLAADALKQGGSMMDAATVELSFRDEPGALHEIAQKYKVDPQELAHYAGANSERIVGRILSNREVWNEGHADYNAAREPATLAQRGGSLDIASSYGVKGAVEFTPAHQAVVSLTHAADATTWVHELAHVVRRFGLDTKEEKRIGKALGATPIRQTVNGTKKVVGYQWDRQAEENFARSVESYVRTGRGPSGLKQAFRSLAPTFREVYDQADLPDLPPHVAQLFERLHSFTPVRGGRIFGAEDVQKGLGYAPMVRGMPVAKLSQPHKALLAYFRRAQGLFAGGSRRAIGAGPDDIALKKEFTGALLLSGFFTRDVVGPKVASSMLAIRMAAAHTARGTLLKAGSELPRDISDIAVIVDPKKMATKAGKEARADLHRYWDRIASLEQSGGNIAKALDGVDFDLIERARQDVLPAQIDGRDVREVAADLLETQQPIDNIVWVDRGFLDQSQLLHVPSAARLARSALGRRAQALMRGSGVTLDSFNDFQKGLILYLNPSYIPVNLAGNLAMNVMHQGVFAPANLWRSVMLHRSLESIDRLTIDRAMGSGLSSSLSLKTAPGRFVQDALGHYVNQVVDLIPRRSAFLHEARKAGLKDSKSLSALLSAARDGQQGANDLLEQISRKAKDGIVDYDRLSPFEREVVSRVIFFYPWLHGASRYSIRFIADHPMQAMALALMYEHAQAASQDILGDRPYFANLQAPISTKTLGFKVPGTNIDIGLDQAVGVRTWKNDKGQPMAVNFRQAFTQTTPLELLQSGIAFATGMNPEAAANMAQNLTPLPYAVGVGLFGYDPFQKKEVPPGVKSILDQFSPLNMPLVDRLDKINMSPSERATYQKHAINPRSRSQEWWRLFGGGLAPAPFNKEVAAKDALATKSVLERETKNLIADSKDAGLGQPPQQVLDELRVKVALDHEIHNGDSWEKRAQIVAQFFDRQNPGSGMEQEVKSLQTEGEAKAFYQQLRSQLYPTYAQWNRSVESVIDANLEQQPVAG